MPSAVSCAWTNMGGENGWTARNLNRRGTVLDLACGRVPADDTQLPMDDSYIAPSLRRGASLGCRTCPGAELSHRAGEPVVRRRLSSV